MSQRRCCALAGLSRSMKEGKRFMENEQLLTRLVELAKKYIRFGYRRIHGILTRQEGWQVNVKRVHRLWKQAGLQVRKRKRRRRKPSDTLTLIPLRAKSPNHVWTVDFVYDTLASGRSIRLLSVVDEFTRQCLALRVEYSLKSVDVQATLETLFKDYGRPLYLRSDNGSEFIASSLQKWLKAKGTSPLFIDPGSPWQNGKCESFNGRLRDECLNAEYWGSLREAQNVIELWRDHYNTERPHSALDYWPPEQFTAAWYSTNTKPL
ncbi:MAG: IS3 family transposase, partial [Cyanobacteria bacterium HKST-UBA05]|nr:IS3 family transposase [Cyanobacteria bacterium HKST-UBA05]